MKRRMGRGVRARTGVVKSASAAAVPFGIVEYGVSSYLHGLETSYHRARLAGMQRCASIV